MAESESGQEKTEMPTPKKLQELMESGQFARSQEVQTLVLLLAALLILTVMAPKMVETFRVYMIGTFQRLGTTQMNVFVESFSVRVLVGVFLFGFTMSLSAREISNYLKQLPNDFVMVTKLLGGGA